MTKQESAAVYAAFAELESAAEQFHVAAHKLGQLVPSLKQQLDTVSEELNFDLVDIDTELDEVV
jgi:hypothetical protein